MWSGLSAVSVPPSPKSHSTLITSSAPTSEALTSKVRVSPSSPVVGMMTLSIWGSTLATVVVRVAASLPPSPSVTVQMARRVPLSVQVWVIGVPVWAGLPSEKLQVVVRVSAPGSVAGQA
jgi:hypothetical protein